MKKISNAATEVLRIPAMLKGHPLLAEHVALPADGKVKRAWEDKAPAFEAILKQIAQSEEKEASLLFVSTNPL